MCFFRFHFAVKVNLEGKGCGVENGAAVCALPQMALNFTCYLRCETPLQIFANQSNCRLACHAHNLAPRELGLPGDYLRARNRPKPYVNGSLPNHLIQRN